MPSKAEHLAKAESNERLSIQLRSGPDPAWSVTILFYAALHLVEATLAPHGHSPNHSARLATIRFDRRFRPVQAEYRFLYDLSLRARYDCRPFNEQDVQAIYDAYYEPIKRHLQPLLGFSF
ncbi:MAG: hypothetical protein U0893_24590 [Chloroflexota bacterium]